MDIRRYTTNFNLLKSSKEKLSNRSLLYNSYREYYSLKYINPNGLNYKSYRNDNSLYNSNTLDDSLSLYYFAEEKSNYCNYTHYTIDGIYSLNTILRITRKATPLIVTVDNDDNQYYDIIASYLNSLEGQLIEKEYNRSYDTIIIKLYKFTTLILDF